MSKSRRNRLRNGRRTECGPALADVAVKADILRIEAKIDAMENRLLLKLSAFIVAVAGLTLTIAWFLSCIEIGSDCNR